VSPEGDDVALGARPATSGPCRLLRGVSGSRERAGERVTDELRVADDEGAVDQDVSDARRGADAREVGAPSWRR